jgi:hypothetical protein
MKTSRKQPHGKPKRRYENKIKIDMISQPKGRTWVEGDQKYGAKESIWT